MVEFIPRISFVNKDQLVRSRYPGIRIPIGVTAYEPILVTAAYLRSLATSGTTAVGFTNPQLSVLYENMQRQWQSANNHQYRFTGGNIYIDMRIGIYADNRYQGIDEAIKLIIEHEHMHVRDEVEIVCKTLVPLLIHDPMIRPFLVEQQIASEGAYRLLQTEGLLRIIQSYWAEEHSRRARLLHSGNEYFRYMHELSDLMPAPRNP